MNDQISTQMAEANSELDNKAVENGWYDPDKKPEYKEEFFQSKEEQVDVDNPVPTVQ